MHIPYSLVYGTRKVTLKEVHEVRVVQARGLVKKERT
jgi:hypothetical protein